MPKHWHPELEKLKAITRVVADTARYHARTPSNEAWCGAPVPENNPLGQKWRLMPLLDAEEDLRLVPCDQCFDLKDYEVTQERLNFD